MYPVFLNYDYSMDAVPLVLSFADVRLLLPAACYVLLTIGVHSTMYQFQNKMGMASGFGLALFALAFFPMSNILFPVGTLIAERLLYIPSLGYLVVIVAFFQLAWERKERLNAGGRLLMGGVLAGVMAGLGRQNWDRGPWRHWVSGRNIGERQKSTQSQWRAAAAKRNGATKGDDRPTLLRRRTSQTTFKVVLTVARDAAAAARLDCGSGSLKPQRTGPFVKCSGSAFC